MCCFEVTRLSSEMSVICLERWFGWEKSWITVPRSGRSRGCMLMLFRLSVFFFISAGRVLYFMSPICSICFSPLILNQQWSLIWFSNLFSLVSFSSHEFFTYKSRFFITRFSCWADNWKHLLFILSGQLHKSDFKKHIQNMLLSILEAEDDYVEAPILLQKIAKYVV